MCAKKNEYDEEELFAHTRMSLGDHIEELRVHLFRAIKGFIVAMFLGFFVAGPVLDFLKRPLISALEDLRKERVAKLEKELKESTEGEGKLHRLEPITVKFKLSELIQLGLIDQKASSADGYVTLTMMIPPAEVVEKTRAVREKLENLSPLKVFSITEGFMIWFKVSLYSGFILASPWIFYQVWSFIAAGLYPHEKKYIHVFLPLSIALFIAGVCLCQFLVLPLGIKWLLSFSESLGFEPELRLSEWLSFSLLVPLVFGIAFQLPLLMFGLERVGIFSVETYRSKRRIAIFLIFLISGLANASPDPISMSLLAVPLCVLYELGIILCKKWPRHEIDLDVEETDERVEV